MNGAGDLLYGDETHQRMNMELDLNIPGVASGMTMKMKSVSDGEYTWSEIENAMLGATQVIKSEPGGGPA